MKAKHIENYIVENYGECKQDPHKFSYALELTAKEFNLDTFKLFLLVLENQPIDEAYTHSYGFHTANGREIINTFKFFYNSHTNQNQ